jgi:hypothetical protein
MATETLTFTITDSNGNEIDSMTIEVGADISLTVSAGNSK